MDTGTIAAVVGTVVTIVASVAGTMWVKAKEKLKTASSKAQTLSSLVKKIVDAFEDDDITSEEFKGIIDEAKKLLAGE